MCWRCRTLERLHAKRPNPVSPSQTAGRDPRKLTSHAARRKEDDRETQDVGHGDQRDGHPRQKADGDALRSGTDCCGHRSLGRRNARDHEERACDGRGLSQSRTLVVYRGQRARPLSRWKAGLARLHHLESFLADKPPKRRTPVQSTFSSGEVNGGRAELAAKNDVPCSQLGSRCSR